MPDTTWKVAEHEPLVAIADGLWTVNAELDLLPIDRRMTIMRRSSGDLLVHSAVACDEPTMAQIDALGPVGCIVVPSASHTIDAPRYAARYPEARVLCPRSVHKHVEKVVGVHGYYDDLGDDPAVRVEALDGIPAEGVFVHTDAQGGVTLIFNDALMNLPDRLPGFKGWLTKVMGSTGGLKVTGIARRFIVKDRRAYRAHLERLAAISGLRRIVVSHGGVVMEGSPESLQRAAQTLD